MSSRAPSAWALAAAIFTGAGSMPVTSAPSRACGALLVAPEFPAELVADISEAHGIDAVKRLERSVRVPPFAGALGGAGDLLFVERGRALGGGCHRAIMARPAPRLSSRPWAERVSRAGPFKAKQRSSPLLPPCGGARPPLVRAPAG